MRLVTSCPYEHTSRSQGIANISPSIAAVDRAGVANVLEKG